MREPKEIAQIIEDNITISNSAFLKNAGLPGTTIANMKSGSMPSADKLGVIAENLGVSVDYLLAAEAETALTAISAAIAERCDRHNHAAAVFICKCHSVYSFRSKSISTVYAHLDGNMCCDCESYKQVKLSRICEDNKYSYNLFRQK